MAPCRPAVTAPFCPPAASRRSPTARPWDFVMDVAPPPTATCDPVTPGPASAPVDSITLHFSEPVTGFSRSNLRLTRDGDSASLITPAMPLTALPDGRSYTLSNLAAV